MLRLPSALLLLSLALSSACRAPAPATSTPSQPPSQLHQAAQPPQPPNQAPNAPASAIAVEAGNLTFTESQLTDFATQQHLKRNQAAELLATLALVAQEAPRTGITCPPSASVPTCARQILNTVFPDQPDCQGPSEADLDSAYETAYAPAWLYDNYQGQATISGQPPVPFSVRLDPATGPDSQGWKDGLPPQVLAVLPSLLPGSASPGITAEGQVYTLRLDAHQPPRLKQDPAVRADLKRQLCLARSAAAREKWMQDLRQSGFVKIRSLSEKQAD